MSELMFPDLPWPEFDSEPPANPDANIVRCVTFDWSYRGTTRTHGHLLPCRIWFDQAYQFHKTNGPAVELGSGEKLWYEHGEFVKGGPDTDLRDFAEYYWPYELEREWLRTHGVAIDDDWWNDCVPTGIPWREFLEL